MKHTSSLMAAVLGFAPLATWAAEGLPENPVTVGNPAAAAQLPPALLAAYASGARDIIISPGTYVLPANGRNTIELISWKNVRVQARGVTLVFEELAHRPVYLRDCDGVTLEGPVVQIDRSSRCTFREVTLQNSGFAAFFETHGEGGHLYFGCKVAPGPRPIGATEDPLVGCGADGFHSAGVRNGPTLDRCVWEGLLHDDCIAIHGYLQNVEQVEGDKLILEKGNRGGFVAGEPVRISGKDGFFGEFTCAAMRTLGDGRLELTLDRPSGAPAGAKASNPRCNGAGFKILNCTLGNTRSRGILVKADHGLIEGNTISGCGMSATSIGPEYYWNEADYSRQVTIRGNTLTRNVLNGSAAGTVFIHGDGAMGNANITIADNLFDRDHGQTTLHVAYTDGIRIANNRFIASSHPLPGKARTAICLEASRNIHLTSNTVENPAAQDTLVSLGKGVEAFTGNDASGIRPIP